MHGLNATLSFDKLVNALLVSQLYTLAYVFDLHSLLLAFACVVHETNGVLDHRIDELWEHLAFEVMGSCGLMLLNTGAAQQCGDLRVGYEVGDALRVALREFAAGTSGHV